MVKLADKHGDSVQAIAMNVDFEGDGDPPSEDDKVTPLIKRVLEKQRIDVENLICTTPIDDVTESLKILAGLPAVVIYDTEGKVVKVFDGQFSYETEVGPVVEDLLAGVKPASE